MPTTSECIITGSEFAQFAEAHAEVWSQVRGVVIRHANYGTGTIQTVQPRKGYVPLITILFSPDAKTSTFNSEAFKNGKITEVELPRELADSLSVWRAQITRQLAQAEAEEAAQIQLCELAKKYNVKLTEELTGITPLIPILLKILLKMEGCEILQDSELLWLEEHSMNNILATYHYRRYRTDNDPWELMKACRHLRKSGLPEKCIEVSGQLIQNGPSEPRVLAAAHTTRGGAYRDLGDLEKAMTSANQAVSLSPNSFHPYNLLGALHYEKGDPAEGDKYFEKAVQLGAQPKSQDAEILAALNNSAIDIKKVIADYLLRKDPVKYAWARTYLDLESLLIF